jgi:hypothetical protein
LKASRVCSNSRSWKYFNNNNARLWETGIHGIHERKAAPPDVLLGSSESETVTTEHQGLDCKKRKGFDARPLTSSSPTPRRKRQDDPSKNHSHNWQPPTRPILLGNQLSQVLSCLLINMNYDYFPLCGLVRVRSRHHEARQNNKSKLIPASRAGASVEAERLPTPETAPHEECNADGGIIVNATVRPEYYVAQHPGRAIGELPQRCLFPTRRRSHRCSARKTTEKELSAHFLYAKY